jgi:hypothetical protein
MAVNHLIAVNSVVDGIGIIGGSPYGCNILPNRDDICSGFQVNAHLENTTAPWSDWVANECRQYMKAREARGAIDPLSGIKGKPVYLFSGTDDVWVYQSVMRAVALQFRNLSANVEAEFSLPAAHSWVVDDLTCTQPGVADKVRHGTGRYGTVR